MTKRTTLLTLLLLAGCGTFMRESTAPGATTTLQPAEGSQAAGTVKFTPRDGKMLVTADVTGLTPGAHGFHIHEKGDCSAPDAMSAGGHFNPAGAKHGGLAGRERHAGDLGNLTADSKGRATLSVEVDGLSLTGANGVVGKAVIVHADPDDLKSQPAGNSGQRIACGVITMK